MTRQDMRILIVGLGSMGKRRIRNLQSLNFHLLTGFDVRADRCEESAEAYNITCFSKFEEVSHLEFDAWIISTPPDVHYYYMERAVSAGVPAFIEASVVDDHIEDIIAKAARKSAILVPSATMMFHPAVKIIGGLLRDGSLGKISNIVYLVGQYLPDWHKYESVSDYYVSNRATGGAREIVPFELVWLTSLFGFPKRVGGMSAKTIAIPGAESIDDTYNLILDFGTFLASLVVDVVSRHATRRMVINCADAQLIWDWDKNNIMIFRPGTGTWEEISYDLSPAQKGYNKNLGEQMYIEEMDAFISHILEGRDFPHSMKNDLRVLQILYSAEASSINNTIEIFK